MKISKLTIAALLTMGLVLTGCNTNKKSSPTSDSGTTSSSGEAEKAVTAVNVQRVNTVLVGQQLDFEELVEVVYGDGSKDKAFTLEVPAAFAELVTVEGKKVTFNKEGSPKITIKAEKDEKKQASFNTTVVSKLKKDVTDAYLEVTNDFSVAVTTDGTNFSQRVIHRPNFTYMPSYPSGGLQNGRGYMKFESGRGYSYTVTAGVIECGEQVEYDNYFVTMDLDLMISEMVTLKDANEVDYLHLSSAVPSEWAQYGYYSHVHFLMTVLTGLNFSDPYYDANDQYLNPAAGTTYTRWESINVYEEKDGEENIFYLFNVTAATYTVAEHEDPTPEYEYAGEDDQIVADSEQLSMSFTLTALSEQQAAFPLVEAFVADPDNEPVTKDFSKVQNFVASKIDGNPHNYTVVASSEFNAYNPTTGAFMRNDVAILETYLVNQDAYDIEVTGGKTGAYGGYWAPADASSARGYAEHGGVVCTYTRDGATNPAEATEYSSIYGTAVKNATFASLSTASLWSDFYVSAVSLDEAAHEETYLINPSRSVDFIRQMLYVTDAGYYFLQDLTEYWEGREDEFIGYADYVAITLELDDANENIEGLVFEYEGILANFGSSVGAVYFETEIEFSAFGSTAAVNLTDITWPA